MSKIDDFDVIDSATRRIRSVFASFLMRATVFLTFSIYQATHSVIVQQPNDQPRAGPGAAVGEMARDNAVPRRPTRSVVVSETLAQVTVVVAAVAMTLSFLVPWRIVRRSRRRIAEGFWSPPSARTTINLFVDPETIQSETGQLAFVYGTQLVLGAAFNLGAASLAAVAYELVKDPIALGVALLLLGATSVRFPTRGRIAPWIEGQQEWLGRERQHPREERQEGLFQPAASDDRKAGPAVEEERPDRHDAPSGSESEAIELNVPVLRRRPFQSSAGRETNRSRRNPMRTQQRPLGKRALPAVGTAVSGDPDWPTLPVLDLSRSSGHTLAYRLSTDQGNLYGCLVFTLFWNGIVAVLTIAFFTGHLWRHDPARLDLGPATSWSDGLLLVPLVLVGLLALYFAAAELLATLGVRPTTVELSDHPLVPGRRYDLFLSQAG